MNIEDDAIREIRKKKKIIWLAIAFFGFGTVAGILSGDLSLTILGGGFVIVAIIFLRKINGLEQNKNTIEYQPGIGFKHYRKTKERKLKEFTFSQCGILGMILLSLYFQIAVAQAIVSGILGIILIQYHFKRRINIHTKIDDASLFELEEIGIITSKDIVKALYKDFESWNQVKTGNKILLVTQDSLLCIIMENKLEAFRMECRLREIRKLGVIKSGKQGEGMLVSIGTVDNRNIRLKLEGNSIQDSPEEFFTHFLQALDEALTSSVALSHKRNSSTHELQAGAKQNVQEADNKQVPKLKIRQLDFYTDQESSDMATTHPTAGTGRFLDL